MSNIENIKTTIIPYSCLEDIRQEIHEFAGREDLNKFQKWIASEKYVLDPKLDFEPKSIIIAAVPGSIFHVVFDYKGGQFTSVNDHGENTADVKELLSRGNSFNYFFDYWLPQKRLAVRSGLADYGRNNICYVKGMGSLFVLFCFISDMPCPENYNWREVRSMPECEHCDLCLKNCPTNAIKKDRFLIDNQKCLSSVNEWGTDPFPEFVPKSAHHRTVHCNRCRDICPANKGRFDKVEKTFRFDQDETELLLSGDELEKLPASLAKKIEDCDMKWYYKSLPRNLRAFFESGNCV